MITMRRIMYRIVFEKCSFVNINKYDYLSGAGKKFIYL